MASDRIITTLLLSATLGALVAGSPATATAGGERAVTFQSAATHTFPGAVELNGAGLLWRTRHAIRANLSPTGLDPIHGYTVWWIIFNNPDACTYGNPAAPGSPACGPGDLGKVSVDAAIFYGGGFISDANGLANVDIRLDAGDVAEGIDVLIEGQDEGGGNGLDVGNGFGAEVHLIFRSHQPASDGAVDEQIGTFAGLCGGPPDFPNCEDQQALAFTANPPD